MEPWEVLAGISEPSPPGDAEEDDADGVRTLLRPLFPFYTRRGALEGMATVVRASPPATRPTAGLQWRPEPPGTYVLQTPHETEVLGGGGCHDLEMHAARADLDAGAQEVELCMTMGGGEHRIEHVFGRRRGRRRDHSAEAGMPALPPARYERRVCVRVDGEETMAIQAQATSPIKPMTTGGPGPGKAAPKAAPKPGRPITTGGPSLDTSDYAVHGIGHWGARGWDRAAAQVAQQYPQARPLIVAVIPGIKSCASYFSSLYISAWDQAGNQARIQRAVDASWQSHWAEHLLRKTYYQQAAGMSGGTGDFSDYVVQFEKQYGRPPTDVQNVKAAVRAFIYVVTSQEWPSWRSQLAKTLTAPPTTMEMAAVQMITVARGIFPPDAFPVPPHCPECAARRGSSGPVYQPPENVTITNVYASSIGDVDTATAGAGTPVVNAGIAAFAPYSVAAAAPTAPAAIVELPVNAFTAVQGDGVLLPVVAPSASSSTTTNTKTNTNTNASTTNTGAQGSSTGNDISGSGSGNVTDNITVNEDEDDDEGDDGTGDGTDDGTGDGTGDDSGDGDDDGFAGLLSGGPDDDDTAFGGDPGDMDEDLSVAEDSYAAPQSWDDEQQAAGFADNDDEGPTSVWLDNQEPDDDPDAPATTDFIDQFETKEGDEAQEIHDVLSTGGGDEDGDLFTEPGGFDDPESWFATSDDDCDDGTCPMDS